ncbi:hypothetical protein BST27_09125 [Mycobacterium intermedium]|uniref:Uncharacterized protein n=2 Tax=Mycobacterium intermedium TaxID=28445 RepID=A0A1T3WGG1_MYCIE|nr:DUF6653 family protein [Mycobacterium intermedium]MCV6967068.1 hypothetical protein [Mycobacterium intermedium]OPE52950.1 hypothetical protein BV508_00270 [Mycobacterium intermedium]ORB07715.1 hypothetical protein BST27_09125 [Mycobacterium intermedium]
MFARHCHPWSAWTRWASTPLTLVPVWTRRPSHAVWVGLWLALNPFVFGKPSDENSWATRAMLGEERWIIQRPKDAAMLVSILTSAISLCGLVAARRRRLWPAVIATALQMALTMVYWALMVRYFERTRQRSDARPK